MDLFAGSAMLGGIMGAVFAAWALGRWQGGLADTGGARVAGPIGTVVAATVAEPQAGAASAMPCQQAERAARREAFHTAASLGELHAEVSAYRRAEQVLAGLDGTSEMLMQGMLEPAPPAAQASCRYAGLLGQPTCTVAQSVRPSSAAGPRCAAAASPAACSDQPSAASAFSRV